MWLLVALCAWWDGTVAVAGCFTSPPAVGWLLLATVRPRWQQQQRLQPVRHGAPLAAMHSAPSTAGVSEESQALSLGPTIHRALAQYRSSLSV